MHYLFELGENGLCEATVAGEKGEIHVTEPKNTEYGLKAGFVGNTYPAKDTIKDRDWDTFHPSWTGDEWQVDVDPVREVIRDLLKEHFEVTCAVETVYEAESLKEFRGKIPLPGEPEGTIRFIRRPYPDRDMASRSWVKEAARKANWDDVEAFAERFNLNMVDDDEMEGEKDGVGGLVGSASGIGSS